MVRTQLYLPDAQYARVKKNAEDKNISFAAYIRILLDREETSKKKNMTIQEKYPFIGMFKGGKNDADNDEIDKFILDQSV